MEKSVKLILIIILTISSLLCGKESVFPGAGEDTPSRSEYFSWINNTNEGATEKQTLVNLAFFKWLKDEFGMKLDIYAFDAGAIDGKRFYGSTDSERFGKQFPRGFDPVYLAAKKIGTRLGIWGGPDGFGNTPEEEKKRIEQMVKLCRDYNFALFKFDAVCGPLRPEKEDAFVKMMKRCRSFSPDLILLNHRLGLKRAKAYATTFLWEGAETYIDVFMTNRVTAPHHRAGAISRGLVPGLKRLTEDHGVCLSSCLDNWDDDLILQAFNRDLILSPQIYGNPWLLRDDEFSRLARIFNLHRKYRDIMVRGIVLPKQKYGPEAVSRGDGETRLITLRNLTWNPVEYRISAGKEIGLRDEKKVTLIRLHPYEKLLGKFDFSKSVAVKVEPFRSTLILATTGVYDEPLLKGVAFNVARNVKGKSVLIDIVGDPGGEYQFELENYKGYKTAYLKGMEKKQLTEGEKVRVVFPGKVLKKSPNRKIANMVESDIPGDAESLYEATVFSADNNALEVRSLFRSGRSDVPQVKKARSAFFEQRAFRERGVWDRNLFDSDIKTGFWPSEKYDIDLRIKKGALRIDLGEVTRVDSIVIKVPDIFSLQPLLPEEGNYVEVSSDLKKWRKITYIAKLNSIIDIHGAIRYLRFKAQPRQIVEIEGYYKGKKLDRSGWRASNLFAHPDRMRCRKSWKTTFSLDEIPKKSYLCVALNGRHGEEGVYVAAKIDGKLLGAPDRAPSYPSNSWEYIVAKSGSNYTYYIPLKDSFVGKKIEVFALGFNKDNMQLQPEVWLWTPDKGRKKIRLELKRKEEKNNE